MPNREWPSPPDAKAQRNGSASCPELVEFDRLPWPERFADKKPQRTPSQCSNNRAACGFLSAGVDLHLGARVDSKEEADEGAKAIFVTKPGLEATVGC